MADLPIIFSGPMVLGLVREAEAPSTGKTQTRRVLKPHPELLPGVNPQFSQLRALPLAGDRWLLHGSEEASKPFRIPYAVGDRLWVREAWRTSADRDAIKPCALPSDTPLLFECDDAARSNSLGLWGRCRRSIHMPRWASRLTLTVTDVRVQRLQEISEGDAKAEGAEQVGIETGAILENSNPVEIGSYKAAYCDLWDTLHGHAAWDANPWVVALTFTVGRRNIDARGT